MHSTALSKSSRPTESHVISWVKHSTFYLYSQLQNLGDERFFFFMHILWHHFCKAHIQGRLTPGF